MVLFTNIVVVVVAFLHFLFLVLEMFLWERPIGLKILGMNQEKAKITAFLAANQGLYNGFLSAGLIWGLILGPGGTGVIVFFLGCVVIAGIYGAATASRMILWLQAVPGLIGLILVLFATN